MTSDLSLASLSKIYRSSLVCRLFGIELDQYAELCALLSGANLLSSPTDTLAALTKVRTLLDRGWTLPDLTCAVGGRLSEKETQLGASRKVVEVLGLDADAVSLFSSSDAENRLGNITVDGLLHLQEYQSTQEQTASSGNKGQDKLSDFFAWVRQPAETKDDDEIYDRLSKVTSWSAGQLKAILTSKYPNWSTKDVWARFQAQEAIAELASIYRLLQGLKQLTLEPELLFRIATPELVDSANRAGDVHVGFANLQDLELAIKPHAQAPAGGGLQQAYDGLRDRRRTALVQHLLGRPDYRAKGILDADHLFEHLLIDVQMDPQLETSRIKQAISTVQLFVQRCMLGHEKTGNGNKNCVGVSAVQWKYMAKYTLWEANRKLFLYPEN